MDKQNNTTYSHTIAAQQPAIELPTSSKSKLKPFLLGLLAIVILVAVGYGVYSWQHKKVSDANSKVSSLQSQVSGLQSQVNKLSKGTSQPTTSTSTSSNTQTTTYATLSPATVPSKIATCTQTLTTAQDGTVGPLTCSNGALNATAWQYIANHYSVSSTPLAVMTLGYNATCHQVLDAMGNAKSKPMAEDAETISAQYYGWHFPTNPTTAYANQQTSC